MSSNILYHGCRKIQDNNNARTARQVKIMTRTPRWRTNKHAIVIWVRYSPFITNKKKGLSDENVVGKRSPKCRPWRGDYWLRTRVVVDTFNSAHTSIFSSFSSSVFMTLTVDLVIIQHVHKDNLFFFSFFFYNREEWMLDDLFQIIKH